MYLAAVIYMLIEYWLGKTNKVKSSSVMDLVIGIILIGAVTLITLIKGKSDGKNGNSGN